MKAPATIRDGLIDKPGVGRVQETDVMQNLGQVRASTAICDAVMGLRS